LTNFCIKFENSSPWDNLRIALQHMKGHYLVDFLGNINWTQMGR
jgi:hypothetical protein